MWGKDSSMGLIRMDSSVTQTVRLNSAILGRPHWCSHALASSHSLSTVSGLQPEGEHTRAGFKGQLE